MMLLVLLEFVNQLWQVLVHQRQFSSCVLIETDDSLDSINATSSSIVKYVSQKAGIGIGAGNIRAIGSRLKWRRNPQVLFINYSTAVKSCPKVE